VVNDTAKPTIYVMFQDYEYYTEYLITFKWQHFVIIIITLKNHKILPDIVFE
jgi:hypothetical protein